MGSAEMLLSLKMAWRSIRRSRRRSIITVCAIAFGLALAVFFVSFGDGVYGQMVDDAVRMQSGHLTIEHPEYRDAPAVDLFIKDAAALRISLAAVPGVERTKMMVLGQGVARSAAGAVGVAVSAVEPEIEVEVSPIAARIQKGEYLAPDDDRHVIIGAKLAERLKVDLGKKLVIATNNAHGELTEELVRVKGIFSMGADEIDAYFIQVPITFGRRLFALPEGAATQLGVVIEDAEAQAAMATAVQSVVASNMLAVRHWQEVLPELDAYIRIDRGSNLIFQGVLIFMSLFTIFNTLLMSALERTRDFAVLLALGTPRRLLRSQMLAEAAILGLLGVGTGLLLGGSGAYYLQVNGFDLSALYKEGVSVSGFAVDTIVYARVSPAVMLNTGGWVFIATLLCSLLPMRRIASIKVADVLR